MKLSKIVLSIITTVILSGCANLAEVREFASQSANLAAYDDLTVYFRDTYSREQPYLWGDAKDFAIQNDLKRKAAYQDLLKLNDTVVLYMQTLGKLAGEEATNTMMQDVDKLAISSHREFGVKDKDVEAVSNIAKIIAKWAMSAYQDDAVKAMIQESDDSLQVVLNSMNTVVRAYKGTFDNERKYILDDFLANQIALEEQQASPNQLTLAAARRDRQQKAVQYSVIEPQYEMLQKAIASIAEGHKKLFDNINHLDADEVKKQIDTITLQLKFINANLNALKSN